MVNALVLTLPIPASRSWWSYTTTAWEKTEKRQRLSRVCIQFSTIYLFNGSSNVTSVPQSRATVTTLLWKTLVLFYLISPWSQWPQNHELGWNAVSSRLTKLSHAVPSVKFIVKMSHHLFALFMHVKCEWKVEPSIKMLQKYLIC